MKIVKKVAKWSLALFVVIAFFDVSIVLGFGKKHSSIQHADAAIVLGAAIGSPSAYNRAFAAARLAEAGNVEIIVTAGGRIAERDISEAQYMARVIKSNIIENTEIILEEQSGNTYENIKNAKKKIPNAKSVVIVSDEFHLARGVILAKRAGFETVYWTAPKPSYYEQSELRRYYIREMLAMIGYLPHFMFG
jgi:uncharacterized SAM-binding protein YcdF (DUF218 family)